MHPGSSHELLLRSQRAGVAPTKSSGPVIQMQLVWLKRCVLQTAIEMLSMLVLSRSVCYVCCCCCGHVCWLHQLDVVPITCVHSQQSWCACNRMILLFVELRSKPQPRWRVNVGLCQELPSSRVRYEGACRLKRICIGFCANQRCSSKAGRVLLLVPYKWCFVGSLNQLSLETVSHVAALLGSLSRSFFPSRHLLMNSRAWVAFAAHGLAPCSWHAWPGAARSLVRLGQFKASVPQPTRLVPPASRSPGVHNSLSVSAWLEAGRLRGSVLNIHVAWRRSAQVSCDEMCTGNSTPQTVALFRLWPGQHADGQQ